MSPSGSVANIRLFNFLGQVVELILLNNRDTLNLQVKKPKSIKSEAL